MNTYLLYIYVNSDVTDTFTFKHWFLVLLNALFETFSCVYSEIMLTIISFFQKLIKGGVGIRVGVGKFSKINKRVGTITRYSRVLYQLHYLQNCSTTLPKRYHKEHKAVSTPQPFNIKMKSTNIDEGKEKIKENQTMLLNP